MHIQDLLQELKRVANEACETAQDAGLKIEGAINWADLSCVEAKYCENDSGQKYYAVLIEECSPVQNDLYQHIYDHLKYNGWDNVDIEFAW